MAWTFWLANSFNTNIGLLDARNKQLSVKLNEPGTLSCNIDVSDPLFSQVAPLTTIIKAYQDGILRWGGPVWNTTISLPDKKMTIQAKGWFEYLNHRLIRDNTLDLNTAGTNAGIELGTTAQWTITPGSIAVSSTTPHSGTYRLDATSPASSNVQLDYTGGTYPADGTPISFSAWVKQISGTLTTMYINGGRAAANQTLINLTNSWQFISLTTQALSTSTLRFNINGVASGSVVAFDDAVIGNAQNVFVGKIPTTIAKGLLDYANQRQTTPIVFGSTTTSGETSRDIKYSPFQNIGQEINNLSQLENGFDYWVDPSTGALNFYHSVVVGTIYGRGTDKRTTVLFGYKTAADNLLNFSKTVDTSWMTNWVAVQGKYTTQTGYQGATDATSVSTYGAFDESVQLSEVIDNNVLLAYANAEVAIRSNPRIIYEFIPKPYFDQNPVATIPRPYKDYDLGDIVSVSANDTSVSGSAGNLQVSNQAVRIYGFDISIPDDGGEYVTSLQTSP